MSITRINNNVGAIIANHNIEKTGRTLEKSIERLSSGLRINRAGDDAAGLTVATRLRSQVQGLDRAVMNAQDGINVVNVAEGALQEVTQRLDRIRVLSIQAANTGVNDVQARQALQDEVFQSIDEITRIANTTQFSKNRLLNGDFKVDSRIKPGQDGANQFGIHLDTSPSASTLESGVSFLNIIQTQTGFTQLVPGMDTNGVTATMHLGVNNASDIAVTLARFSSTQGLNGTAGINTTRLGVSGVAGGFFNGVSIYNGDQISFRGVLADGITVFGGTLSASNITRIGKNTDTTVGTGGAAVKLLGAINRAIDQAEAALFGVSAASVPASYRTTVTLAFNTTGNRGRLLMVSQLKAIDLGSIDIRLSRGGNIVTQALGVTRSGPIGMNSVLSGVGQIGNAVTAVTGSTFGTGQFEIKVDDVQGAQSRIVQSEIVFRDHSGAIMGRTASITSTTRGLTMNGQFVDGVYTTGVSISNGDNFTLRGTEADGTTFEAVYTFSKTPATDAILNDFQFASVSGLIAELNYRTRAYTVAAMNGELSRFETAIFTLTAGGKLQLIDDLGRNDSKLSFTLTFSNANANNAPNYTIQDRSELTQEGFAESATVRLNGGPANRVQAGQYVTLYGPEATRDGQVREQVTLRIGTNLKVGKDILDVEGKEYVGQLNGGPPVTFQNGAQNVVFVDNGSLKEGVARILTMNFDNILDITSSPGNLPDPGTTLIISTVNNAMNFQIGAFANQNFKTTIGDLTSQNLGFGKGSGRTVADIDITTVSGANEALAIVDKSLDQINRTLALLGAATNRLEGTVSNLSVSSENLLASESRLRDADIAQETSRFTQSQVLLQAGLSVLTQANSLPQGFLALLR